MSILYRSNVLQSSLTEHSTLTDLNQILSFSTDFIKLPSIKLHGNLSGGSFNDIRGQTDG